MRAYRAFLVALTLFAAASATPAQEQDCVRCHKEFQQGKVRHGAMEGRIGCRSCHSAIITRSVPHKQSNTIARGLAADPPALCYGCHDEARFTKSEVHPALAMGCTNCHDPHISANENLLLEPQPDICYRCHDRTMFTKKDVHGALAMGCTACHDPHSSENEHLLAAPQPRLCFGCHDRTEFARKVVHGALGVGCTSCHSPHSSENGKLLVLAVPEVCFICHDRKPFSSPDLHGPVAAGYCMSCHRPHSSDQSGLLVRPVTDLCLGCHGEVAEHPHFETGPSVTEPVRGGGGRKEKQGEMLPACDSCHDPHGMVSRFLLRPGVGRPAAGDP